MILSIVVPVYNVERYVRRCILSVINQEGDLFKDIELIIVNDGTRDKSVEQIQDLVEKYENITLINQENQGLSMARNNGMEVAHGDYVWFVDSDDWISKNALQTILPFLDNKNDIVSFGIIKSSEKEEVQKYIFTSEVKSMSGKDTFRQGCVHCTAAWKAAYRKEFLDRMKLRFMPGVYNEDDEFCLRVSYLANRVTVLPYPLYYYYISLKQEEGHVSITNTVNPKLGLDFLIVSKSLARFSSEQVKEKDVFKKFNYHIAVVINNGLDAISKCSKTDQEIFCKLYKELGGLNECLCHGGGKYFVEAVLFSLFPNKMVNIYNLLRRYKR